MAWMSLIWGFFGLLLAGFGVSGIVTKQLEFSDEAGRTNTLEGRHAVVVGGIFTAFGIGLMLVVVIAVGNA